MITNKAKYALKSMIALARNYGNGPLVIEEISTREHIPRKFLEAILCELKNAGLLQSRKGKGGGYELHRGPSEITMANILRIIDGPIAPLPCVSLNFYEPCADCADEVSCSLHRTLVAVRDANLAVMEHTTLAEMAREPTAAAA
jgi:Rrf2 family protein